MWLYDATVIRGLSLFSGLSDEHIDQIQKMAQLEYIPEQVQFVNEGDPSVFLHVLVEGTVELFSKSNDRETTMIVLRPISTFTLGSVLKEAVYLMSARTLETAKILIIPAETIREVMQQDLNFAINVANELATRYRSVVSILKENKLRTSIESLANFLLRANRQTSRRGQIELTEDRRVLAALLGITPEHLSRVFRALGKYGVEVQGNRITLTNIAKLKRFAQPTPLMDDRPA